MPRDDRLRWMMWMSVCGMETMIVGLGMGRLVHPFIRLRRRPRALPVEECVKGVGANPEPRYQCFGGFRHWRITLRSLGACVPKRFGAHGRRRVFLWRYHGLSRGAPCLRYDCDCNMHLFVKQAQATAGKVENSGRMLI